MQRCEKCENASLAQFVMRIEELTKLLKGYFTFCKNGVYI